MDAFPQRKSKLVVHGFLLCVVIFFLDDKPIHIYPVLECLLLHIQYRKKLFFHHLNSEFCVHQIAKLPTKMLN